MTQIYFVRHAEPNYRNHDEVTRELSERGLRDRALVTDFLMDKGIDAVLSSPYLRALDTVRHFADTMRMPITHVYDFRERRVSDSWIDDFDSFCKRQWADHSYRLPGGECLREVQLRNISALQRVLQEYEGQRVVIGGHGTSIATVLHWYQPDFGYHDFEGIRRLMPWIIRLDFESDELVGTESFILK